MRDAARPLATIRDRRSGWLCDPDPDDVAAAVAQLASSRFLRERLAHAGLTAVRERTWEAALAQLAAGYERARRRPSRRPAPEPVLAAA